MITIKNALITGENVLLSMHESPSHTGSSRGANEPELTATAALPVTSLAMERHPSGNRSVQQTPILESRREDRHVPADSELSEPVPRAEEPLSTAKLDAAIALIESYKSSVLPFAAEPPASDFPSTLKLDDAIALLKSLKSSVAPHAAKPRSNDIPTIGKSDAAMTPLANHQSSVIPSANPLMLAEDPLGNVNHPASSDQTVEPFLPPEMWRRIISFLRPVDVIRHVLPINHKFRTLAYEALRDVDWFLDWGAWYDISEEFLRNIRPPKSIIFHGTDPLWDKTRSF